MLTKALFAACALLSAGAANAATTFAGTIAFTDTTNNNALTVSSSPNPAPFTSGSLAVNQSVLLPGVLTLTTTFPPSGCVLGCTATDTINLAFTFTSPTAASFDQGGFATETVFQLAGVLDSGSIIWANSTNVDGFGFYAAQDVSFSNGAKARVNIYNSLLAGTSSSRAAQIDIRIRNLADGSAVPEPATWAMFIGGFGLIGGTMRRRRTSVRFA